MLDSLCNLARDLELGNKIFHKPLTVGLAVEVVVVDALNINARCLRADSRNMCQSDRVGASLILSCSKHSDGHLLDVLKHDEVRLVLPSQPLLRGDELLEAPHQAVHRPVLLRLDCLAHVARLRLEVGTDFSRVVIAQRLEVAVPVGTVVGVDSVVLISHDSGIYDIDRIKLWWLQRVEAGGKLYNLVHIVGMKAALQMSQTVEHLNCALRVTDVENFVDTGLFLDFRDVGDVIVEPHLGPSPKPVLVVIFG